MLRHELTEHLNVLLASERFKDYAPNGLQIEGKSDIVRLATAVTADLNSIEQACAWHADALLVHHGYFWKGESAVVTGMKKKRIQLLLNHDVNLLAYHLPLDCYKLLGNNAQLAKVLDIVDSQSHDVAGTPDLLWQGRLVQGMHVDIFKQHLSTKLNREAIHCSSDNDNSIIESIAWCSGGAQDFIEQAANLGVDAYISGEVSERTFYQAQELGIHYFSCGHHATERYGVQALGAYLANEYNLSHQFFDSDNPI